MSLKEKLAAKLNEAYPGEGNVRQPITPQGSSQRPKVSVLDKGEDAGQGEVPAKYGPKAGVFEPKPMKQGDSKEENPEDIDSQEAGKKASSKSTETTHKPIGTGAGAARNFKTVGDATSVINQKNSEGNNRGTGAEEEHVGTPGFAEETEEQIKLREQKEKDAADRKNKFTADVKSLFASETELSEDFVDKALGIFEAYVETRVASEVEIIEERLTEEALDLIDEQTESLVVAVDEIFNEIAETWLEENAVAIENTLRTEATENFMEGLKTLFATNYIEIPEDRIDVVEALAQELDDANLELEETNNKGIEVMEELIDLKKTIALALVTEGLADTEAEKFASLTENVSFEDEDSYLEKLSVIKKQYFPKKDEKGNIIESPIPLEDGSFLSEEVKSTGKSNIDHYVSALKRSAAHK